MAKKAVHYKLRDWIFSRQRYWGEPIPIIRCPECGAVPLKEKDLPLKLPKVEKYKPTGTGESPLAAVEKWVRVKCPKCGGAAKRETNTMPQWAGSCWYYLRYLDPQNKRKMFAGRKEKYWMGGGRGGKWGVDLYVGGVEHAVLHLLYARFWHKFLYDLGIVSTKEPFRRLRNQGLILAADGKKMSKSKGNVVNPNEIIKNYGADTLRVYEMFIGPFNEPAVWSEGGIKGVRRFLDRVWRMAGKVVSARRRGKGKKGGEIKNAAAAAVKKVTEDIRNFKFNTAVSALMVLAGKMEKRKEIAEGDYRVLLKLLSPFAPYLAEELHQKTAGRGRKFKKSGSIHSLPWPAAAAAETEPREAVLAVQVNGRLRDKITLQRPVSRAAAEKAALASEKARKWTAGKKIKKVVFVPGKLVNIVV